MKKGGGQLRGAGTCTACRKKKRDPCIEKEKKISTKTGGGKAGEAKKTRMRPENPR